MAKMMDYPVDMDELISYVESEQDDSEVRHNLGTVVVPQDLWPSNWEDIPSDDFRRRTAIMLDGLCSTDKLMAKICILMKLTTIEKYALILADLDIIKKTMELFDWTLINAPKQSRYVPVILLNYLALAVKKPSVKQKIAKENILSFLLKTIKRLSKASDDDLDQPCIAQLLQVVSNACVDYLVSQDDRLRAFQNAAFLIELDARLLRIHKDTYTALAAMRNVDSLRPFTEHTWNDLTKFLVAPPVLKRIVHCADKGHARAQTKAFQLLGEMSWARVNDIIPHVPLMVATLKANPEPDVKTAAIKALGETVMNATPQQRVELIKQGILYMLELLGEELAADQSNLCRGLGVLMENPRNLQLIFEKKPDVRTGRYVYKSFVVE